MEASRRLFDPHSRCLRNTSQCNNSIQVAYSVKYICVQNKTLPVQPDTTHKGRDSECDLISTVLVPVNKSSIKCIAAVVFNQLFVLPTHYHHSASAYQGSSLPSSTFQNLPL